MNITGTWPPPPLTMVPRRVVSSMGVCGAMAVTSATGPASTVWPAQNAAIYVPVVTEVGLSVTAFWVLNGATINGNIDIGLYSDDGTNIASTGSTAQAGASLLQSIAASFTVGPGRYYIALASDSATATINGRTQNAELNRIVGQLIQASAFALPATATFAQNTYAFVPLVGMFSTPIAASPMAVTPPTVHAHSVRGLGIDNLNAGGTFSAAASAVWPSSNLAIGVEVYIPAPILAANLFMMVGATSSGNVDVGIYSEDGTRIVSSGSTAQSTINTVQVFNTTDVMLGPGNYYLAVAMDNTTGTIFRSTTGAGTVGVATALGSADKATSFPLPATIAWNALRTSGGATIPLVGFTSKAVI